MDWTRRNNFDENEKTKLKLGNMTRCSKKDLSGMEQKTRKKEIICH